MLVFSLELNLLKLIVLGYNYTVLHLTSTDTDLQTTLLTCMRTLIDYTDPKPSSISSIPSIRTP